MVSANNGGDNQTGRFAWTRFYEAVADALLQYRDDRRPLADAIAEIAGRRTDLPFAITDQFADGTSGPLRDICPFTTMGLFNRRQTARNRQAIATELAYLLEVTELSPDFSFKDDGIPQFSPLKSFLFHFEKFRKDDDIPTLWQVFVDAITLADADDEANRKSFIHSYDTARSMNGVAYNLTIGLYWMRPRRYPPLDSNSRSFIDSRLALPDLLDSNSRNFIDRSMTQPILKLVPSGAEYLALADNLRERFEYPDFLVHSFPHLSWAAFQPNFSPPTQPTPSPQTLREPDPPPLATPEPQSYTIANIISDGCFLDRARLETMLRRLADKRNIILQGPPGTGKTWLAKRLAYALVGNKDDNRVRPVQFHPNMSYEDFVRGWRPVGSGSLELVDGPFLRLVWDARLNPSASYVMVIEEVNRGNPAQIFGEMLTLLEADKRNAGEAMTLAYPLRLNERVHIPPNVYVIGTMNIADRSLALVDFALRRRFAFFDLEPTLGSVWRDWVSANAGIPDAFLRDVERRLTDLNEQIATDTALGPQFRIGHSVVTPPPNVQIDHPQEWFEEAVATEIAPLLREYWFDAPKAADEAQSALLADLP